MLTPYSQDPVVRHNLITNHLFGKRTLCLDDCYNNQLMREVSEVIIRDSETVAMQFLLEGANQ